MCFHQFEDADGTAPGGAFEPRPSASAGSLGAPPGLGADSVFGGADIGAKGFMERGDVDRGSSTIALERARPPCLLLDDLRRAF